MIEILFPVLNEELRLREGVVKTVEFLKAESIDDYSITIVDNGSTDSTPSIAKQLCSSYPKVRYLRTSDRGVGLAFREGFRNSKADIVGYMDVDLSTDLKHLAMVFRMFEEDPSIDMINGSRFSKLSQTKGRKFYRKITSWGLVTILKAYLGMKATDAICGFKFFRRKAAERLIGESGSENGWFYLIEMLLRAERDGLHVVEMPVVWTEDYDSTVNVVGVSTNYLKQIKLLKKAFAAEDAEVNHG